MARRNLNVDLDEVRRDWMAANLSVKKICHKHGIADYRLKEIAANWDDRPAKIEQSKPKGTNRHPDAFVESVMRMWREGFSASSNGTAHGLTRSAILGLVHRQRHKYPDMDIPKRPREKTKRAARKSKTKTKPLPYIVKSPLARAKLPPPSEIDPMINHIDSLPLVDSVDNLEMHHCRWPIGDPRSDTFGFCGQHKYHDRPYCVRHAMTARQAPDQNKPKPRQAFMLVAAE